MMGGMEMVNSSTESSGVMHVENRLISDRVEHHLRKRIENLRAGTMLPPQEVLVRELGASRHTIREAMDRLKRDQLVESTRGRGTFVTSRPRTKPAVHLVSSCMDHPYNLMCIGVLTEVLRERGYLVHLPGSRTSGDEWRDIVCGHEQSAGVILIGDFGREDLQRLSETCRLPLVHVSDTDEQFRRPPLCDTVINDNAAMAFQGTDYLIRQGHQRIAFLGWGSEGIWDREVRRGYQESLLAHSLEPREDWVLRVPVATAPDTGPAADKNAQLEAKSRAQIDRWRASADAPTALLHNSGSELQVRDTLAKYCPGTFDPRAVVALTYWEMLQTNCTGESDAAAVCLKFRDIAERAVDLLKLRRDSDVPPTREIQGRIFIAQRRGGRWQRG